MNRSKVPLFVAALGLVTLLPSLSFGSGWLRRGCRDSGCDSAPCPPVVVHAPAPRYEDRIVTRYRPVTKEREVTEVISRMVPKEEKFSYTVMVPVTRQEKRVETCYVPQHREVEYKYTVLVPHTVKETRRVAYFVPVSKEVEYTYAVLVPHVHKKIVKQTFTECRTRLVEDTVPVCRLVRRQHVDECGRCYTTCERVTEMHKVTRRVVDHVPVTRDVEVCEVTCKREERRGTRTVCEMVRREKDVEVCRVECRPEQRVGKRTICEAVPQKREVVVNVCDYQRQERTGVRTVHVCVPEKVTRKVQYCEMVPYQETVRVMICDTVSDHCDHGGRRGLFGGLFHRD
jgi:hypothetical protein